MADGGSSVDSPKKGKAKGGRRAGAGAGAGAGDDKALAKITDQLLENPGFMDALKAQLGDQLGAALDDRARFYRALPAPCKGRVRALKNLQVENQRVECRFHKELHELECRFESEFQSLYDKRRLIVTGEYEPTAEESTFALDEDDDDEEPKVVEAGADGEEAVPTGEEKASNGDSLEKAVAEVTLRDSEYDENTKGLPQFWLTSLQNVGSITDMIEEHDVDILKHLTDIKCTLVADPVGFVLDFHFSENEYFKNSVLTKCYKMKIEVDEGDPFSFDGGEIFRCEGCEIEWNQGKNVTMKTVKKKQKNKKQGQTRTVTKQVKADSFFHFFNPPQLPEDEDEEVDEEVAQAVAQDYEVGLFMKENFIPKAVLYFTGEEDDSDSDDSDGEDEDSDEDYDESRDPDYKPPAGGEQPQECKQQ